jgi:class 3 adenylate cyclase
VKTLSKTLGIASLLLFTAGVVLKYLGLPGAYNTQIVGMFLFSLGFAPMFLKIKLEEETRRAAKISHAFFLIATILMFVAAQLRILRLFGSTELTYIGLLAFMIYAVFFSQVQDGRKLKLRRDRQLAAIVFTDVEGYTRLMAMDEEKGLAVLDENRKIHKKWIAKYRGQWLKEMGDGNIIIFYTATEAVLCGMEMQRETRATGDYALRMGIHISEVLFTDNDAFGDGVNVASRLCGQAKGGEMVVSESVYQNVRNREKIRFEPMGPVELKNVDQPMHLFRVRDAEGSAAALAGV